MTKASNRFFKVWKLGYAKNYSKGRRPARETALNVTFGHEGSWDKLFWRFYWRTSNKGYLD